MEPQLMVTLFLAVLLHSHLVSGAHVLFLFQGGNLSHKTSVWPFALGLAEAGHKITFISSHQKTPQAHPGIIDIAPDTLVKATQEAYGINRFESRAAGVESELWETYDELSLKSCDLLLKAGQNEPKFRDVINPPSNATRFDLVIINAVYGECGYLIATHLRAKYIVFGTTTVPAWFHTTFGLPWQASWIPNMMLPADKIGGYPFSFIDRVKNLWSLAHSATRSDALTEGMQTLHRRYLAESAGETFIEIERNTSLVFINTHPALDFARPLPPWFVQVGGMQCWSQVGQLPSKFQEFMDGAEDGVILIAFGSTIDLNKLSPAHLQMFFATMRRFSKVRFIWRWSGESPSDAPPNLLAADWLPQKEILSHPNLRAFMTHCGCGSVTEAACYGVPMIAVPLFADQDLYAYRIQAQQLGVYLEVRQLSQETLDAAVHAVLTKPEYKKNMQARAALMKDRPMSPVDTAVYWTEFVLRHDDMSAFKPMALGQPWFVRQSFDVFLAFVLVAVVIPLVLMYVILNCMKK